MSNGYIALISTPAVIAHQARIPQFNTAHQAWEHLIALAKDASGDDQLLREMGALLDQSSTGTVVDSGMGVAYGVIQVEDLVPVPVKPSDYCPSRQVGHIVEMINEMGPGISSPWDSERDHGQRIGYRHGQAVILRALVELETGITDSDLIDEICADLINDSLINKC